MPFARPLLAAALLAALAGAASLRAESPPMIGINLAGADFGGGSLPGEYGKHYIYPGVAEIDYYKARGIELVRLPFRWERVQHRLQGELDAAELARIDAVLDLIEERGMRVALDMHNYARYHVDGEFRLVGTKEVPSAALRDVWERLARHFKDRDCLWGYGIMNEPYDTGPHDWLPNAQMVVDAIRKIDRDHAILVPGDNWTGAHNWLQFGARMLPVKDPADKIIFEAHQYFDRDSSGSYKRSYDGEGASPTTGVDRVRDFAEWCLANKVRGFVGEYGVPDDDPRWLVTLDNLLAYLKANGLGGAYWAGGPWWGTYKLAVDLRPAHDEAPQMAILAKYGSGIGTLHWPAFTWYHDDINRKVGSSGIVTSHSGGSAIRAEVSKNRGPSGTRPLELDFLAQPGGRADASLRIEGGVNLARNFGVGHVLSFQAKGAPGTSIEVTLVTTGGVVSKAVVTPPLSASWQRVALPLRDFRTDGLDGTQRIESVTFSGLPADGASHLVELDRVVVEKPDTAAPAVALQPAGAANRARVGRSVTLGATASDDSGIHYVEFLVNGVRQTADLTAPYSCDYTPTAAGSHRVVAIAFDHHGNPARSEIQTLVVSP